MQYNSNEHCHSIYVNLYTRRKWKLKEKILVDFIYAWMFIRGKWKENFVGQLYMREKHSVNFFRDRGNRVPVYSCKCPVGQMALQKNYTASDSNWEIMKTSFEVKIMKFTPTFIQWMTWARIFSFVPRSKVISCHAILFLRILPRNVTYHFLAKRKLRLFIWRVRLFFSGEIANDPASAFQMMTFEWEKKFSLRFITFLARIHYVLNGSIYSSVYICCVCVCMYKFFFLFTTLQGAIFIGFW